MIQLRVIYESGVEVVLVLLIQCRHHFAVDGGHDCVVKLCNFASACPRSSSVHR